MRDRYRIYQARQVDVPSVAAPGLLVMVHELPDRSGTQVTALNFGRQPIVEQVKIAGAVGGSRVLDMLGEQSLSVLSATGDLSVMLEPYEGKSYLISTGQP